MIRSLRAYFLGRALREKLLLVAFIAIGLLWWLSAFSTRTGTFWREQRTTSLRLREQGEWIKNRSQIETAADRAAARLEPTKTLNLNQLQTTVGQLASDAGLRNAGTSGPGVTTRSGQFAIHTAGFTIRGAEWEALEKFYQALQQRAPYIAVDQFILSAQPNNPAQLTLGLRVESVEIVR